MLNSGVRAGDMIRLWGYGQLGKQAILYLPAYWDYVIKVNAWMFCDPEKDKQRIPVDDGNPFYKMYSWQN